MFVSSYLIGVNLCDIENMLEPTVEEGLNVDI